MPDPAVLNAVRQWQTRLLQLDRRNALLYFSPSKRGVALRDTDPDSLVQMLAEARNGVRFQYAERVREPAELFDRDADEPATTTQIRIVPGDIASALPPLELQRRLTALEKRAREWEEEQGLNVLFIALGLLHWVDEDQVPAISPLLLLPCELERSSPRDPYRLIAEDCDEFLPNPTLQHKLRAAAGLDLPEFADESIVDYLSRVSDLVAGREGWSVERLAVVSTFPFSKLAMWEDVGAMIPADVPHPLIRRLAGDDRIALALGPPAIPLDDAKLVGARLDDLLDIKDQFAVLDADFSQLRAVELARSGAHLVVHGPPGTGKSQTIANTIAALLAEGKRVLFVSEKTAALDVVKRRLTEVGLGLFCLDLHSERAKKSSFYGQLRDAVDASPIQSRAFSYATLVAQRDELNRTVRALHEPRSPLGLSVFDVHGRVAQIGEAPPLPVQAVGIEALDEQTLRRIGDLLGRIERRTEEFRDQEGSPWRALGAVLPSPMLADSLRSDLSRLSSAVSRLGAVVVAASTACGWVPPDTVAGARALAVLLQHLAAAPGGIPANWLLGDGLQRAAERAKILDEASRRRDGLLRELSGVLSHMLQLGPACDSRETLRAIDTESRRWSHLVGPSWDTALVAPAAADTWADACRSMNQLAEVSSALHAKLGLDECAATGRSVSHAVDLSDRVLQLGPIPTEFGAPGNIHQCVKTVHEARALLSRLTAAESRLSETFALELVDRVDEEMLVRYRTDHQSIFRRFRSPFRRDNRTIRGCQKVPGRVSLTDAARAVEDALAIGRLRAQWDATSEALVGLLGIAFNGRQTDWDQTDAKLGELSRLYADQPSQSQTLHALLTDATHLAGLRELGKCVSAARGEVLLAFGEDSLVSDRSLLELRSDATAFAAACSQVADSALARARTAPIPNLARLRGVAEKAVVLAELELEAYDNVAEFEEAMGPYFRGWSTDFDALRKSVDWTASLLQQTPSPVPPGVVEAVLRGPLASGLEGAIGGVNETIEGVLSACDAMRQRLPEALTPWGSWERAPLSDVKQWSEGLHPRADGASAWLDFRGATAALDDLVAPNTTQVVRSLTDNAAEASRIILRHLYLSWLELITGRVDALRVAPADIGATQAAFRKLDAELPTAARARVRARCLERYPNQAAYGFGVGELAVLRHELAKQRRQLPVRKLVARIPALIYRLKPCFMMSPLAVSQYLPRASEAPQVFPFDTVIFDEASQVFPEDAIPAISRGRQCIVVGDRQQLPPTRFFRTDDFDDIDEDDESAQTANRLLDVESVLDVLVAMGGSGVHDVDLKVHYRSRHDDLIRYSDHYFYRDKLLTFPSAFTSRPGLGLRSIYLPEGRFEAGGSRTNRIEAARVVEAVFELIATQPAGESVGVVALSRAQADLIEDLINQRRLSDRRFDHHFADGRVERFFVKNLENVQGDERDHIVLSVGYGPTTASGVVPNRFGPINVDGGQRRLNVAVTRARRSMTVVHSLRAEDIRSETVGATFLRRYLEFVRDGERSIEGRATGGGGDAESPFEDAVGRALEQRGHRIRRQVGCAKFAIDIAIMSSDSGDYDLAVECDGAAYHSSPSARDRDRLRQEILEELGWRGRIHRVWSTAWISNPKGEVAAIERALERARDLPRTAAQAGQLHSWSKATVPRQLAPDRSVPSAVVPAASAPLFVPYEKADLNRPGILGDLASESALKLAELVKVVVFAETPVHEGLVVDRIVERYGHRRAGRRLRQAVSAGVAAAVRAGFVSRDPTEPEFLVCLANAKVEPRGPSTDSYVRDIESVSRAELAAGMLAVVGAMVAGSPEDVVTATARSFGYGRLGAKVEGRIREVLESLVAESALLEEAGSVVVARR